MALQNSVSSIGMALAGKTASVDIPKPRDMGNGRGGFAAVPARAGHPHGQPVMLPTPPNSISPTLPPQGFKHKHDNFPASPPALAPLHVESDIDLQDAVEHAKSQDQPLHGPVLRGLDSVGAITPGMLAKHHLPEILLHHGPLAIRHVMGHLATSVPGFAGIPPARARRLVVAALEGRGGDADNPRGDGGEVIFEKVGWGRWDARRWGQPPQERPTVNSSPPSSVPDSDSHPGMRIPITSQRRTHEHIPVYGSSLAGNSAVFSHSDLDYGDHEDVTMLEHEADKMSLDGNGDMRDYCSSSEAPEEAIPDEEWNDGDITDEEDWEHIGAAALRARSLNSGGGLIPNSGPTIHSKRQPPRRYGGGPASSALAKSVPGNIHFSPFGFALPDSIGGDSEERAAVEALLKLGSM
jgi:Putative Sin3 binding protein